MYTVLIDLLCSGVRRVEILQFVVSGQGFSQVVRQVLPPRLFHLPGSHRRSAEANHVVKVRVAVVVRPAYHTLDYRHTRQGRLCCIICPRPGSSIIVENGSIIPSFAKAVLSCQVPFSALLLRGFLLGRVRVARWQGVCRCAYNSYAPNPIPFPTTISPPRHSAVPKALFHSPTATSDLLLHALDTHRRIRSSKTSTPLQTGLSVILGFLFHPKGILCFAAKSLLRSPTVFTDYPSTSTCGLAKK